MGVLASGEAGQGIRPDFVKAGAERFRHLAGRDFAVHHFLAGIASPPGVIEPAGGRGDFGSGLFHFGIACAQYALPACAFSASPAADGILSRFNDGEPG
jgi:hypothetical protein